MIEDPGESIQLRGSYCDNVEISNCNFNIYEINGNKSRQVTNLWFHVGWQDVTVQDCEFRNLTNGNVGGNIWLSGFASNSDYASRNAVIKNNYIEKSCHDESIAVWAGYVDNVIIQENEIYIHEENVDDRSTMNFTFGSQLDGGVVSNIYFMNNNVQCESKESFAYITGEEGSKNIYIEQNTIEYSLFSNDEIEYRNFYCYK